MEWTKRNNATTVADIVKANTGMTEDELLHDNKCYEYPGLEDAAILFLKHVKSGSRIIIHGDYDTDGVTFLSEMKFLCSSLRIPNVKIVAPKRFSDGYGINPSQVKQYVSEGASLLLLGDNGIAAIEAISIARESNVDVIILDHHESKIDENGNVVIPNANVIVDPHITGGDFDDLCGAGLGYRFSEKVLRYCKWISKKQKSFILERIASFAAVGTIGDVVSLTYDNRKIVKEGIHYMMHRSCTKGLSTLLEVFGLEYITSIAIGFNLSAGINAAGRLDDNGPQDMVNLLTYTEECDELSEACNLAKLRNEKRKELVANAMESAEQEMIYHHDDHFIVYYDSTINSGIAGLISGKLTEQYNRPSIVLCPDSNSDFLIKGSGRSVPEINIKDKLDSINTLLLGYGGHPQACGLTLEKIKLDKLRKALNLITPVPVEKTFLQYDLDTSLNNLHTLMKELILFEPYGEGNPQIVFRIDGIQLGNDFGENYKTMGKKNQHIKFFAKGYDDIEIVWFDGAFPYKYMKSPECIDILATLSLHVYKGNSSPQLQITDLKPHVK